MNEMPLRAADDNSPLSNGNGTGHNANDGDIGDVCASLAERVNAFLALDGEKLSPLLKAVQQQTRIALEVIGECLQRYRFVGVYLVDLRRRPRADLCSLEEISLSYNGGKDCLVLLILLLCALSPSHPSSSAPYHKFPLPRRLQSVYIISAHPFAEVDAFVDSSVVTYKLDLARYAMNMKEAFEVYLEEHKKVKAILVGTRRTDPHGEKLTHFDMTDKGWPSFMRVHPVIDWHYAEIWAVSCGDKYCLW